MYSTLVQEHRFSPATHFLVCAKIKKFLALFADHYGLDVVDKHAVESRLLEMDTETKRVLLFVDPKCEHVNIRNRFYDEVVVKSVN